MTNWAWLKPELDRLHEQRLFRRVREVTSLPEAWCLVEGRRLRNFAGNDYLNLSHDPRVIEAACVAAQEAGTGSTASALVCGRTPWHAALETQLAQFKGEEAAILFPTGYAANLGTLAALAGTEDIVLCDRLNHASLVDGCRLSGAKFRVYRHDDLAGLEAQLHKATGFRRRLIVTDSVFSMDGDVAPLPELCALAERFDALLIVDEAHATGVFGTDGHGIAEAQGVAGRVSVSIGTLSKALGGLGGFVAGSTDLIDYLRNHARPQMFSTALPPAQCAAASAALRIIQAEPERRQLLLKGSARLAQSLRDAGLNLGGQPAGPIIPVLLNDPAKALAVARELESAGYLVAAIRPPTVPQGTSRLRITLTTATAGASSQALAGQLLPMNLA